MLIVPFKTSLKNAHSISTFQKLNKNLTSHRVCLRLFPFQIYFSTWFFPFPSTRRVWIILYVHIFLHTITRIVTNIRTNSFHSMRIPFYSKMSIYSFVERRCQIQFKHLTINKHRTVINVAQQPMAACEHCIQC